jgi:hypothetical protein
VVENNPVLSDIRDEISRYINTPPLRYFSCYHDFEWGDEEEDSGLEKYVGEGYYNINKDHLNEIGPGFFHSFKHKESTLLLLNDFFSREYSPVGDSFAVCKFEIPTGSVVYEGIYTMVMHDSGYCKVTTYASNKLKLVGCEIFDYKKVLERRKSEGVYWE